MKQKTTTTTTTAIGSSRDIKTLAKNKN